MSLYELRTYQVQVGKMPEAMGYYKELGFPAIQKRGHDKKLIGYFVSDTGNLHQLVHLWKFDDDKDRRNHWDTLLSSEEFLNFAKNFRPLVLSQHVQLLNAAPWGPHP